MMDQVFDALQRHAVQRPDEIAFAGDGQSLTWAGLVTRIAGLARSLEGAPPCVGIGLAGGCDYVVADLALTLTGRRQVPLPFFFSDEQIAHVLSDTRTQVIITDQPERFAAAGDITTIAPDADSMPDRTLPTPTAGAERVIYTSGSSGRPKGVVIGSRQFLASLDALTAVVQPGPTDLHLSVLPLAQLLEQICGIYLPILAGARVRFDFSATKALFGADITALDAAFSRERPTTSLLVPALLGRWVADLARKGRRAPESLRFVAVGGAASSPALLESAWAQGIPVHEGYGLSECCAVVAMNRPGANVIGTAGEILAGLDLQILDGEITVAGPTVMQGYLNGPPAPARWHTGDLGRIESGRLIIDGRKDALIVTPAGRNISPEWVEQRLNADPRIVSSVLGLRDDGALIAIVVTAAPVSLAEIAALLGGLPGYAQPEGIIPTTPSEPDLLYPAGTPNRAVAARIIASRPAQPLGLQPESLAS